MELQWGALLARLGGLLGRRSLSKTSTLPTVTLPARGVRLAKKSSHQHSAKKVGKSPKDKRNEKHQEGIEAEPSRGTHRQKWNLD